MQELLIEIFRRKRREEGSFAYEECMSYFACYLPAN